MEAEIRRLLAEGGEFVRGVVAAYRMVITGRGEILAHGEDIDSGLTQVVGGGQDLLLGLAEAEHDRGLREHSLAPLLGRPAQDVKGALVLRYRPHGAVEPRHGLDVMRQHLGTGCDHSSKRGAIPLQIRDQHFHSRVRALAYGEYRSGDVLRTAIRHIVAVDHGDDRMPHVHRGPGLGHATWLIGIPPKRPSLAPPAKGPASGAALAPHPEPRRARPPPPRKVEATPLP